MRSGDRRGRRDRAAAGASAAVPLLEVTEVAVLPAGEEPDAGTAADVFPGLLDSHEDLDEGWMARWLDRPTWDHRVTPNVIKRTGTRPARRRR
jgi:hypothetical protein